MPRPVRSVVADSWRRSTGRCRTGRRGTGGAHGRRPGLLPGGASAGPSDAALPGADGDVRGGRRAPSSRCATRRAGCCWVEGHPATRRLAGRMNFVPGARWWDLRSAPTRRERRSLWTGRCRCSRPSTSSAGSSPGRAPRRRCTIRARGGCSARWVITGRGRARASAQSRFRAGGGAGRRVPVGTAHTGGSSGRHGRADRARPRRPRLVALAAGRSGSAAGTARSWCCWQDAGDYRATSCCARCTRTSR